MSGHSNSLFFWSIFLNKTHINILTVETLADYLAYCFCTEPGGTININLKFNVHKCITYHSRCTGKRWEPISTCPAPFNIQAYAFSSSLPALFLLVISSFYFFNKSIAMKEKGSLQISLSPLSLSPSVSLSLFLPLFLAIPHVWKKMKRRRFERLPAADCLLVRREIVCDPQLCVSFFFGLTAPHRAGPQCSRPPVSERCSAWNMRELGSVRSGPGELCRWCCCCRCCCWVRGWRRIGQTAYAHTQLHG